MPAILEEIDNPKDGYGFAIPLVLIHDGGGSIFQYFMVGSLGRTIYGIANPYFESGVRPEGGIPQLAKEYAEAIRGTIETGPVIIGGWSFGGVISVEIARILQGDPHIRVVGLLMIDSSCPWVESVQIKRPTRPSFREETAKEMKTKVNRSFDNTYDMISAWDPPGAFKAPPAILIRAEESVSLADSLTNSKAADGWLGWSDYDSLKFLYVVDVPGGHFSMFDACELDNLTEKMKEACNSF